jgi:phospholipase/lecithinase/hemolysin
MQSRSTQFVRIVGCLALGLAAFSAQAREVPEVVVFGDSLSDPGNHFIAFGESARRPFEPVPSASYAIGGHHFSNGRTWIEQLVRGPGAGPALGREHCARNYAVGRARARAGAPDFPDYDLTTQVGLMLADTGGALRKDRLYVLWIGGNDVRDALVAIASSGGSPASQLAAQQILTAAVQSIADNVVALYAGGAREFLVGNVPDPAATPVVRELGPAAQGVATYLSGAFNTALAGTLQSLGQALPDSHFIEFDANAVLQDIVADPAGNGFTDVTEPCLAFGVTRNVICSNPGSHLFWDGTHPTAAGHRAIAHAVAEQLAER